VVLAGLVLIPLTDTVRIGRWGGSSSISGIGRPRRASFQLVEPRGDTLPTAGYRPIWPGESPVCHTSLNATQIPRTSEAGDHGEEVGGSPTMGWRPNLQEIQDAADP